MASHPAALGPEHSWCSVRAGPDSALSQFPRTDGRTDGQRVDGNVGAGAWASSFRPRLGVLGAATGKPQTCPKTRKLRKRPAGGTEPSCGGRSGGRRAAGQGGPRAWGAPRSSTGARPGPHLPAPPPRCRASLVGAHRAFVNGTRWRGALTLWPFSPGSPARPSKPRSPCGGTEAARRLPSTVTAAPPWATVQAASMHPEP